MPSESISFVATAKDLYWNIPNPITKVANIVIIIESLIIPSFLFILIHHLSSI